ncbi:MAG: hypothetical protein ACLGXA_01680 [Acidobacteriota bacterium]
MKPGIVAGLMAALLAVPLTVFSQGAGPGDAQPENAERIESGSAVLPGGDRVAYRIRLLPVTSFPDLPAPVAGELQRRQCMIPQSFEARQPENVIRGSFRAAGSSDWAALCSSDGTTTLYVFFAGQFGAPVALRSQPDSAWLGAEPGSSVFGSSWGISARSGSELRATPELRRGVDIDHDAIDDARLERSWTIHYFQNGRWITLQQSDGGNED